MNEVYVKAMEALTVTMTKISDYSLMHLEIVLAVLVLAFLFAFLFAKTNVKKTGILLFFGILMLLVEILRQLMYVYLLKDYNWSCLPWQICSIPMYLCLFYPAVKKLRDSVENFLVSYGLICSVVAFLRPREAGLFTGHLFLTIFAILWHGILLTLAIYMIMTSKRRSVRAFRGAMFLYLIGAAVALLINFLTKTHFFYLGPNKPHLYLADTLYAAHGWIVESVVMVLATTAAAFVVYFVSGMGKKK